MTVEFGLGDLSGGDQEPHAVAVQQVRLTLAVQSQAGQMFRAAVNATPFIRPDRVQGFGAMSYAGRHPGFFRAAASFSGTLDMLHSNTKPISSDQYPTWLLQTHIAPNGYDALDLFGDPTAQRAVWAAHNPADLVKDLHGTRLFVSCGNGRIGPLDPPGTDPSDISAQYEAVQLPQNKEFVRRATRLGLDVAFETYTARTRGPTGHASSRRRFRY
jgi:hypothetical protein